MKTAAEFWNGKRPLSQAFWLVWIVGGVFVGTILWLPLIVGLNWFPNSLVAFVALASIIVGAYQIFCFVSVWQCAVNVKARVWMVVARILVVLSVVQMTRGLIQTKGLLYAPVVELFHQSVG